VENPDGYGVWPAAQISLFFLPGHGHLDVDRIAPQSNYCSYSQRANHLQSLFHELWSVDGDTAISGGCVLFACDKKGALGLGLYSALLLKRVFIFPRLARFGCDQAVVRAAERPRVQAAVAEVCRP